MKRLIALALLIGASLSGHAQAATGDVTYTYDAQGRVISATYGNGSVFIYTYDPAGNRLSVVTGTGGAAVNWNSFNWNSGSWHN